VRRRGLDAIHRVPRHHAVVIPHYKHPRRGLEGWCGQAPPLVPSRRRGVVVWNIHHCHLTAANWGKHRRNRWRGDCHGRDRRRGRRHLLRIHSCGHTARGLTHRRAVLPVTRGALDERRLVEMDASTLSALVGARRGTVGATL
jgi:hypothetical protein